jgi:hypothetical protein
MSTAKSFVCKETTILSNRDLKKKLIIKGSAERFFSQIFIQYILKRKNNFLIGRRKPRTNVRFLV